jgi:putative inorganic carbon (HCO3(-)) transporter
MHKTLRTIQDAGRSEYGAGIWIVAGVLGLLAMAATVAALESTKVLATLVIAITVSLILLLVRDKRQACFIIVLLLAPLRLGKAFLIAPHMGGAAGFWIDSIDPFLIILLGFQVKDVLSHQVGSYKVPRAAYYWIGMIMLGLISIVIAPFKMLSAHETLRMVKLLVLFLVVVNEVLNRKQFLQSVTVLMIGVMINSMLAITQWVTGAHFDLVFLGEAEVAAVEAIGTATYLTGEVVYRPGGLMGAGNLFAAYVALLLPTSIALMLVPTSRPFKIFLLITILLGQTGLVLTLSRTGWIDFLVAFVVAVLLGMWHPVSFRRFYAARVAIIATTVVIGLAFTPMIIQRLTSSDPGAVNIRLEWLDIAKAMVIDHPVLGVGLNNYVYVQLPYGAEKTPDEMIARYGELWPVVHNTWAVTWAEQGTIGFLLFLIMHFSILGVGLRNLRIRDPIVHAISVGLLAGFLAIMVDGLASFYLRMDQHARVFWIVTGLLIAAGYFRQTEKNTRQSLQNDSEANTQSGDIEIPGWLPKSQGLVHLTTQKRHSTTDQVSQLR